MLYYTTYQNIGIQVYDATLEKVALTFEYYRRSDERRGYGKERWGRAKMVRMVRRRRERGGGREREERIVRRERGGGGRERGGDSLMIAHIHVHEVL